MQSLAPPVYAASNAGLIANYNGVTFAGDFNIAIPLSGTFQGDAVKARSLYIDNYYNATPVTYQYGGKKRFVPAYTSQYIDVTGIDVIILTSTQSMQINLSVMDTVESGGASRGMAPGGNFDQFYGSVLGLWHFDGPQGATFATDSKNPGQQINEPNTGIIITADYQYGGSCGTSDGSSTYLGNQSVSPAPVPWTLEFSAKPVSANSFNVITIVGESNPLGGAGIVVCYRPNGAGKFQYELWRFTGGAIGSPGSIQTQLCVTGYNYTVPSAVWNVIALVVMNTGFYFYVDGNLAMSNTSLPTYGLAGSIGLFSSFGVFAGASGICRIDEMRLSAVARYFTNYTPLTAAFPSQ